jgi:hypothetical protein
MSMTTLRTGFAVALVVASAGAGFVLWQANSRLQESVDELQRQQQMAEREKRDQALQAAAAAKAAQAEHEELLRLRSEVEALRRNPPATPATPTPTSSTGTAGKAEATAATPANSRTIPVEAMGNAGRATPRAAGQTEAWAVQHGDVDTAASLLTFAPEERARLEAVIAALPENLRAQYATPERLMAMVMAGTPRPIAGVQILDEKEQGPDEFVQQIQLQYADGRTRNDELTFQRDADGWKRVVSASTVDRVIAALKNGPISRTTGK